MFVPDPDLDVSPIPDPESRGQKGTGSRMPDPVPQHCQEGKKFSTNKRIIKGIMV
jgi:hypothetical protein